MDPENQTPEAPATTETPSEPPATTTPSSEDPPRSETEVELEEVDFSALTDFVEKDGEVETPPVGQVAEEEPKSGEETPPEKAPEPVETKSEDSEQESKPKAEAEPEKTPEKTAAEEQPPAQPEVRVPTEEELKGMYKEHREKTLPIFEEKFKLTEEEAAALDEQPSKVLPKLAAELMYDTMLATYNAVLAALPSPVNRLIEASQNAKSAEVEFYDAWPELKGSKHHAVIGSAIQAFRAANPRADRATVIKQAGVMAMLQLGLDPVNRQKPNGQAAAPPALKPTPPKPAGGRNTAQTTPPKPKDNEPDNIFAGIAEAFQKEMM